MSESELPTRINSTDSTTHDSAAENAFEEDLETTIFVGDIRKDSTEKELVDFFSQFGSVAAVSIKYSKITRQPLGYGFVKMSSVEEVERILSEHPTVHIKGKRVRLGSAKRNCKLRIHNLASSVTESDLNEAFNKFGDLFEHDTSIIHGVNGVPNSGILHFKSRRQAQVAKLEMNNTNLCDRPMRIEWYHQYNTKSEKKDTYRSAVPDSNFIDEPAVSLHVKFKTFEEDVVVNEDVIRHAFQKFGHVTLVSIKTNIHDTVQNRYRGYAFVHYENNYIGRNSAIQAVNAMQLAYCNGIQYVTQVSNNFMRHEEHIPVYYYPALPMPTTPTAYFTSFDEFDNDPPQPLPPSAYNMYYPPYENADSRQMFYNNNPVVEMRYSPAPLWPQYIIPANSNSFYQLPEEFPHHVPSPRHRNSNHF